MTQKTRKKPTARKSVSRKSPARMPRAHSISSKAAPKPKAKRTGPIHHAKRVWHITPKFVHGSLAGAFIGIIIATQLGWMGLVSAISLDTPRDCDDYAIIRCGSLSTAELQRDYKKNNVSDVYSHFGISASDINAIGKTAVKGTIYDDGSIKVNGKKVANDAITASWKSVNGSTKVKNNGTSFYVRHLKASWSHKSAPAYVVMKNGEFDYAVLASCGNPIIADAIPAPKPKPKPTPPPEPPATPTSTKPKPKPPTPEQPIIETPPLAIEPVAEESDVLPAAGPGALILIAGASVLGGFLAHHTHRHIKRRRAASAQSGAVGRHAIRHATRR